MLESVRPDGLQGWNVINATQTHEPDTNSPVRTPRKAVQHVQRVQTLGKDLRGYANWAFKPSHRT